MTRIEPVCSTTKIRPLPSPACVIWTGWVNPDPAAARAIREEGGGAGGGGGDGTGGVAGGGTGDGEDDGADADPPEPPHPGAGATHRRKAARMRAAPRMHAPMGSARSILPGRMKCPRGWFRSAETVSRVRYESPRS